MRRTTLRSEVWRLFLASIFQTIFQMDRSHDSFLIYSFDIVKKSFLNNQIRIKNSIYSIMLNCKPCFPQNQNELLLLFPPTVPQNKFQSVQWPKVTKDIFTQGGNRNNAKRVRKLTKHWKIRFPRRREERVAVLFVRKSSRRRGYEAGVYKSRRRGSYKALRRQFPCSWR